MDDRKLDLDLIKLYVQRHWVTRRYDGEPSSLGLSKTIGKGSITYRLCRIGQKPQELTVMA